MINKIYPGFVQAVSDIKDGAIIMVGGAQGPVGWPRNLIVALRELDAKNLTLICGTTLGIQGGTFFRYPGGYLDAGILVENRQVKKVISPFPLVTWQRTLIGELYEKGEVELEVMGHGTMVERIRAGAAGIGGFYTPVGVGTILDQGKEHRIIDGKEYILEFPLKADFSLIWGYKADTAGNLVYRGSGRNYNPVMAKAANVTIVEVEEIVNPGELDPEEIVTPGIYVHRIVQIPKENR
jgi:3-oxoacid CoA-transferase subunit A